MPPQRRYLVAAYNLSNLERYTVSQKGSRLFFYFPQHVFGVGQRFSNDIHQIGWHKIQDVVSDKYLILHEALDERFGDGMAIYILKKSVALAFLDRFLTFIWAGLATGIVMMLLLSWWVANRIIEPVERLTQATRSIIET